MALVVGSAMFVGLLPAWQATRRTTLTEDLGDGKGALAGSLKPWMRQLLIGAQAALVMIVLAGAALLVRSAINLQQEPIGFDTHGVLTARVALARGAIRLAGSRARPRIGEILERVQSSPGVTFAALDSGAPLLSRGGSNGLFVEGRPETADLILADSHFVSPGYFSVVNNPLRAGRVFTDAGRSRGAARDDRQRDAGARGIRIRRSDRQANQLLRRRTRQAALQDRRRRRRRRQVARTTASRRGRNSICR